MNDVFEDGVKAIQEIVESKSRLAVLVSDLEAQVAATASLASVSEEITRKLALLEGSLSDLSGSLRSFETKQKIFEERLEVKIASLSRELSDRVEGVEKSLVTEIRGELRDSRESTRDRMDNAVNKIKETIDAARQSLIAEMPKSIFGKRGPKS